jgi:prepilin-type N-terminal cleavage/methylation domain-containing protein
MKQNVSRPYAMQSSQRGFTLVEMAIVLVIIGVILASVMVGRDVQRNSEYVKIRQTFINQWVVAYNTYWQRMGGPFGDNILNRTLMVNGANIDQTKFGGDMTDLKGLAAICAGTAQQPKSERTTEPKLNLRQLMLEAGVELPAGRGLGKEDRYAYLDSNGNPQEIQVCFQWNPPGTASGTGNVMVISGLTPDLAKSLAVGIKGVSNANTGSFRQQGLLSGSETATAVDWSYTNDQSYTKDKTVQSTSATTNKNNRESQVQTVVAYYKMNQ